MDTELDRLDRKAEAAAAAVREHLAAAVRIWRGTVPPPGPPLTPITGEWLADHLRLTSERQRAETALQDYLSLHSALPIGYQDKGPAALPDVFAPKTQRPNRAQRRAKK